MGFATVARNDTQDPLRFEIDGAIVEQGFSGGPVLDSETGTVVGLVVGGLGKAVVAARSEVILRKLSELGYREDEGDGDEPE